MPVEVELLASFYRLRAVSIPCSGPGGIALCVGLNAILAGTRFTHDSPVRSRLAGICRFSQLVQERSVVSGRERQRWLSTLNTSR